MYFLGFGSTEIPFICRINAAFFFFFSWNLEIKPNYTYLMEISLTSIRMTNWLI